MTKVQEIPVIDAVRRSFCSTQLEDAIDAISNRKVLGIQVQLDEPTSSDASLITAQDEEFLWYLQQLGQKTDTNFGGFNACNDISAVNGRDFGWHIDTLEDWLTQRAANNSFNGLSTHKSRVGEGVVGLRLASRELIDEAPEWLVTEISENALLASHSLQETRFQAFVSGVLAWGEVIPGRWTIFSHGVKQLGHLPLWHYFSQNRETTRRATAVFQDTATTAESLVHFDGLAKPVVSRLMATAEDHVAA